MLIFFLHIYCQIHNFMTDKTQIFSQCHFFLYVTGRSFLKENLLITSIFYFSAPLVLRTGFLVCATRLYDFSQYHFSSLIWDLFLSMLISYYFAFFLVLLLIHCVILMKHSGFTCLGLSHSSELTLHKCLPAEKLPWLPNGASQHSVEASFQVSEHLAYITYSNQAFKHLSPWEWG